MNRVFQTKFELLKKEMDAVQGGIASYGEVQFKIKGWAITIFSAFVFFALEHDQPALLLACTGVVLLFWLLDGFYKGLQEVYLDRAMEIQILVECLLRKGAFSFGDEIVFRLEHMLEAWEANSLTAMVKNAGRRQIAPLYVLMIVLAILLWG